MQKQLSRPAIILLIDDDVDDQTATRRALKKGKIRNQLYVASDGEEGLDFLLRRGDYVDPSTSPTPDMILLDINMPKVDGREVLAEIRKHDQLKAIPVVVLTTSRDPGEVKEIYKLGCSSFITKPVDAATFAETVRGIESYWFEVVVLPTDL